MNNIYAGFIIITAFASAVSQILLNISNNKIRKSHNIIFEYLNIYVMSSYFILLCVLIANIYIMQYVQLKIAHALAASTYVFVLILSKLILKERITKKKAIGNIIIIIGIVIFVT